MKTHLIPGIIIIQFIIIAFAFLTSFISVKAMDDTNNICIDDSLDWVEQNDPQEIDYYKSSKNDYIHWAKGCWYLRNEKNIDVVYLLQKDIDYFGYKKCTRCIHDDWDDD